MSVISLQRTMEHSPNFTLNCTSTGSPATTVTWRKDGTVLGSGGQYEMTQRLQDGATATYENIMVVGGTPSVLLGVYSCSILNEIGTVTRNITVNGECSSLFKLPSFLNILPYSFPPSLPSFILSLYHSIPRSSFTFMYHFYI